MLGDAAVTVAVHESPGRLLEIAEAKVIEADPDLHRSMTGCTIRSRPSRSSLRSSISIITAPRPTSAIDATKSPWVPTGGSHPTASPAS